MFCEKCGAEVKENAQFCTECGSIVEKEVEVVQETTNKSDKVWNALGKAGFIGGLICFICSFIPFLNIMAYSMGIPFIVLSALGKKTSDPACYYRANRGLKFAIAAVIIGFVGYILLMFVLGFLEGLASAGSSGTGFYF